MTAAEVLQYLRREIHTTVAATTDRDGLPVACAIDRADADEAGLFAGIGDSGGCDMTQTERRLYLIFRRFPLRPHLTNNLHTIDRSEDSQKKNSAR